MRSMEQDPCKVQYQHQQIKPFTAMKDKNYQTDIVLGKDEMKQSVFDLLTKRNYSRSDMPHDDENAEIAKSAQSRKSLRTYIEHTAVLGRELKEARSEIVEMDKAI